MHDENGGRRAALYGAAFAALVTLPGLGIGTLWDNSETAYGEVAREIVLYRDAVLLHFNGAPWFVQPPLWFWAAALCSKLFGLTPFALRLPSALATIALGAITGGLAGAYAGRRAGIYAGLILASSLMQAVVGRLAVMDALLDFAVGATIAAWFEACLAATSARARGWWFFGGWFAAALGTLAKGPVAVLIPALVCGSWYVWERRMRGTRLPAAQSWVAGIVLYLAVSAPWFILIARRAGTLALAELIGHYSFGRFLGTIENQTGPLYYYVPVVVLGVFPWFAFLVPALISAVRGPRSPLERLAVCWALVPFVFFSLAQTKLPNYIALELPALAIIVATWLDRSIERGELRGAKIAAAFVPLTIGAVALALAVFARDNRLPLPAPIVHDAAVAGAVAFAGAVLTFGLLLRALTARAAPYALSTSGAAFMLLIVFLGLPDAEALKPIPPLAAVIDRLHRPGDAIAIANVSGTNALIFYTAPPVETDPSHAVCSAPRAFVVTTGATAADAMTALGRRRHIVAKAGKDALVLIEGPPCVGHPGR